MGAKIKKCESNECGKIARFVTYWPGQKVNHCFECAQKALRIAGALGVVLSQEKVKGGEDA